MFSASLSDLIGKDILRARDQLKSLTGFDAAKSPAFWESWIATQLGGNVTPHKCAWDVAVQIWGKACHVEIKHSNAFWADQRVKSTDQSGWKYKWALPRGLSGKDGVQCIVLVGLSDHDEVHTWVMPIEVFGRGCSAVTISSPASRRRTYLARYDQYLVPPTELLPAVASICHNRHDTPHRQANAAKTSDRKRGQSRLFEEKRHG